MGIRQRRKRDKENLHQVILKAAEELFVMEGYSRVSMRRIAEKIEYSPTTIYLYFKDKASILAEILETYQIRFYQIIQETSDTDDPLGSVRKGMRLYVDFGLQNPEFYKMAFLQSQDFKPEAYLNEGLYSTKAFYSLHASVEACIQKGLFKQMDIDLATQVIWSMNHGITSLLITNPNFPWVERESLIDAVIEHTILGFLV